MRHDGARKLATNSLKLFYEDKSIVQSIKVSYFHQTNGLAECAKRAINTIGRSKLHHAKRDKCFWNKVAMTAIYDNTCLLSPKLENKITFEIVHKLNSSVKHMRVLAVGLIFYFPRRSDLNEIPSLEWEFCRL